MKRAFLLKDLPPVPVHADWTEHAGSYKNEPFDAGDARAGEPLVNLAAYGLAVESYYARTDGGNIPYKAPITGALRGQWARVSVAEKLVRVNAFLVPYGVEVLIWDAYRPVACQQGLWDFFMARAVREMPDADDTGRRGWVLQYVSDPTAFDAANPQTWPVHTSGGAVDLTLRDVATGALLDMGTHFDDMSAVSRSDYFEVLLQEKKLAEDHPPLLHRRLLFAAMEQAGFINYPLEFWHFDWGDQMYVHHLKQMEKGEKTAAAWYGYIAPPED